MDKKKQSRLTKKALRFHKQGDFENELKTWQTISKHQPDAPEWKHNIALALMNLGHYIEALQLFDQLIEEFPDLSRAHNNRAALLIKLGVEYAILIPAFLNAMITSESLPDLMRHFYNACWAIAYGLDDGAKETLLAIKKDLFQPVKHFSSPEAVESNMDFFSELLDHGYMNIVQFRQAFSNRKWIQANKFLLNAKTEFERKGIPSHANVIERVVLPYFSLTRDVISVIEKIGSGKLNNPEEASERLVLLRETAIEMAEDDVDLGLQGLLHTIGWFLTGMLDILNYLCHPIREYDNFSSPSKMITNLTTYSNINLGRDLASILEFSDRQCVALYTAAEISADFDRILQLRDATWAKIALFCNGLALDFQDIDVELARSVLGWSETPIQKAQREIQLFKSHIERQSYRDMFVDGKPQENIGRALLQSFLVTRSYREVPVRGGQTDILTFAKNGRFLYETKIWRGEDYHLQGLREIEEYIIGEDDDGQLNHIFYVIFDPTKSKSATSYLKGPISEIEIGAHQVTIIAVNIALLSPSKKRN